MPKIFDCFTFFNELDLLEIRLHELDPVVDRFVLCESTFTFKGKPKPLIFKANRERFAPFLKKIVHVVVDDMPLGHGEVWNFVLNERHQRNAVGRGLGDAQTSDFICLCDLDEIPRASSIEAIVYGSRSNTVFSLEMRNYHYFVNLRKRGMWNRARMARFGDIRNLQTLRSAGPSWLLRRSTFLQTMRRWKRMLFGLRRLRRWTIAPDAGWHFSSLNGPAAIVEKVRSYAHVHAHLENVDAVTQLVNDALADACSPTEGSSFRLEILDDQFPAYLVANQVRFAPLIADLKNARHFSTETD
jgi:beta-1,4-mannosyl-glycoprotein beta-1,4-N-acetylglucosaminyltransferase